MIFNPERCSLPDEKMKPFIDADEIWGYLNNARPTSGQIKEIIQ